MLIKSKFTNTNSQKKVLLLKMKPIKVVITNYLYIK